MDRDGNPNVIDFGVARVLDGDDDATTLHTGVGQLVGTLQYMSPEQCAGDPGLVDARCDVYALGIVLYEMLTGEPPYELDSRSVPESIRTIGGGRAPSTELRRSRLPRRPRHDRLEGDREGAVAPLPVGVGTRGRRPPLSRRRADRGEEGERAVPARQIHSRRHKALVGGLVATFTIFVLGTVVSTALFLRAESARRSTEFRAYVANIAARPDRRCGRTRSRMPSEGSP